MIIHDKFVFIHNCHCGGNTVRVILKNMFPYANHLPLRSGHWHKPIRVLYKNDYWGRPVNEIGENDKNKIKFGYVRNPWDWYVSFYYHQKRSNGLFYKTFTTPEKDDFETFVRNLLSPEYNEHHEDVLFFPPGDPVKHTVPKCKYLSHWEYGFFTYRCTYFFCKDSLEILNHTLALDLNNFKTYITADALLKTEDLVNELMCFFERNQIRPERKGALTFLKIKSLLKLNELKRNAYRRERKQYSHYYSDALRDLVYEKDRLLINTFNYQFEKK